MLPCFCCSIPAEMLAYDRQALKIRASFEFLFTHCLTRKQSPRCWWISPITCAICPVTPPEGSAARRHALPPGSTTSGPLALLPRKSASEDGGNTVGCSSDSRLTWPLSLRRLAQARYLLLLPGSQLGDSSALSSRTVRCCSHR